MCKQEMELRKVSWSMRRITTVKQGTGAVYGLRSCREEVSYDREVMGQKGRWGVKENSGG